MLGRMFAMASAVTLLLPLPVLSVSDGHYDVGRQGCESSDFTYDQKDVDHAGDGCETITVQVGPAEENDFVRAGIDHEPEGVAPHSGSVKVGRKGETPGDDSSRITTIHWNSGYAVTGPRTLSPGSDPKLEKVDEPGVDPSVHPENATPVLPERPLDWSHYFGMDDNWIFGEHHSTAQPGFEDLETGPVSGGGWSVSTHPDSENFRENVDLDDRRRPIRAADAVMGFCNDGLCMSITTEERTIYQGGDENAEPRPAYIHSGNPPNGGDPAVPGDGKCGFRTPDADCQEFHDNQGEVYVPWGVNFYQDPHPAAPERFGPKLWEYPMPSSHVGSEGLRVADEEIIDLRLTNQRPLNLGHRGTGVNTEDNLYPENTILSFIQGLDEGADGIELDVQLALDNGNEDRFDELVVMHDESLSRTTTCKSTPLDPFDPSSCVSSRTVGEIQATCLPVNGKGDTVGNERVPTLREALTAVFEENINAFVNIEIKSQPPTEADSASGLCSSADPEHRSTTLTIELLAAEFLDKESQIIISSFDPSAVALAKQTDSTLDVGYLSVPVNQAPEPIPPVPAAAYGAALAAGLGLDSLHSNVRDTTREVVDLGHALDLTVRPWTVNEPCDMRRLIDLGVDAIITDEPDLLAAELSTPSFCP